MSTSKVQESFSLQDVISKLEGTHSIEHRGLLMAAEMIVRYLKLPPHEITIALMKERQRNFPLFLSWRGLPLDLIDRVVEEVDRLIHKAEELQTVEQSEQLITGLAPVISLRRSRKHAACMGVTTCSVLAAPDLEDGAA